jgi:hypothetical protein
MVMQIQLWKITQPKNSRFFGAQPELNAGTADSLLPISFFPAGKKITGLFYMIPALFPLRNNYAEKPKKFHDESQSL